MSERVNMYDLPNLGRALPCKEVLGTLALPQTGSTATIPTQGFTYLSNPGLNLTNPGSAPCEG